MESFLLSTSIVALAEMGDKTQLLSFVLAAKLKHRVPIIMGILFATLANHFFAGYVGSWVASLLSPGTLKWIVAISFFGFGIWALKPDKLEENRKLRGAGAFITTLIAFFIASASYRAFRVRTKEATVLLITAVLVLLGKAPLGDALINGWGSVADWVLNVPNTGGFRAITIGAVIGAFATGFRIMLGLERAHLGGGAK